MMSEMPRDAAYRVLELERRIAAYQKVHDEELDELRQLLSELKDEVLTSTSDRNVENRVEGHARGL
jgi:hypothetical protein